MSYVALAVTVGGALYQGDQSKQSGKIAGIFAESQARIEEAAALETARIIRKAGRRQIGSAKAAMVASGVKIGEGSAELVENEMLQGVEHDAYQAILEGKNRSASTRQGGRNAVQAGKDANTASVISAAGTALSGYGQVQRSKGWRTTNTTGGG